MGVVQSQRLSGGHAFTEGLRWHCGYFWWSDIFRGKVFRCRVGADPEDVASVDWPSGLGWTPNGDTLVVAMREQRILRIEGEGSSTFADLSPYAQGVCNDMLVCDDGWAYVGCLGFDLWAGEQPRPTRLLAVSPNGQVSIAADGLMAPNGMALVAGGGTLVVAESFGARLVAFDRAESGQLSNKRIVATFDGGMPDGMCAATNDSVWVADPLKREILHVALNGEIRARVEVAGEAMAVDCEIGGEHGDLLGLCMAVPEHSAPDSVVRAAYVATVPVPQGASVIL